MAEVEGAGRSLHKSRNNGIRNGLKHIPEWQSAKVLPFPSPMANVLCKQFYLLAGRWQERRAGASRCCWLILLGEIADSHPSRIKRMFSSLAKHCNKHFIDSDLIPPFFVECWMEVQIGTALNRLFSKLVIFLHSSALPIPGGVSKMGVAIYPTCINIWSFERT